MFELDRGAEACWRFEAAFETGQAPLPAKVGLALCQIRYGQGAAGFKLISEVLGDPRMCANPRLAVQAGLVLGEYHLLSHHWDQAAAVYDVLIRDDPTHYSALRGFHEVCLQTGRYDETVMAWHNALQRAPGRREFRSFLVWTLSLAADESARAAAEELLASDPDNPLACFALMVEAIRAGDLDQAVTWVQRARAGAAIPKAHVRAGGGFGALHDRPGGVVARRGPRGSGVVRIWRFSVTNAVESGCAARRFPGRGGRFALEGAGTTVA